MKQFQPFSIWRKMSNFLQNLIKYAIFACFGNLRPCGRTGDVFREARSERWREKTRRAYRRYAQGAFRARSMFLASPAGPGLHRPIPARPRLEDAQASSAPVSLDLERYGSRRNASQVRPHGLDRNGGKSPCRRIVLRVFEGMTGLKRLSFRPLPGQVGISRRNSRRSLPCHAAACWV